MKSLILFLYRIAQKPWHPIIYLMFFTYIFWSCNGDLVIAGKSWYSNTKFWIYILVFTILWSFFIEKLISLFIIGIFGPLAYVFRVNLPQESNLFCVPKEKISSFDPEFCEQMFIKKNNQEIQSNSFLSRDLFEMYGQKEKNVSNDVIIMKMTELFCSALFTPLIDINKSNQIFNKYIIERYCQNSADKSVEDSFFFAIGAAIYAKNQRLNLEPEFANEHLSFLVEWFGAHPAIMDKALMDLNNFILTLRAESKDNKEFVYNLIPLTNLLFSQKKGKRIKSKNAKI